MSRTGWSATNFLRLGSAVVTGYPVTMAAWFITPAATGARRIVGIYNSASTGTINLLQLGLSTATSTVFMLAADASAGTSTATTNTFSVNVAQHVCGVFTSATVRAIFLNGGGKVTDATSRTPVSLNRTSIGLSDNVSAASPMDAAGSIGEVAIWKIDLSDADVARHASGISAIAIRREFLVGYWPMLYGGDEVNVVNPSQPQVVQGALSVSAPPAPVFMPRLPSVFAL